MPLAFVKSQKGRKLLLFNGYLHNILTSKKLCGVPRSIIYIFVKADIILQHTRIRY